LLPRPFLRLSLQPCAFFGFGGFLEASMVCSVGSFTSLLDLFGVHAQLMQFRVQARSACVSRLVSLSISAPDVLHDLPEFAGHPLRGVADFLFPRFATLLLPAQLQPYCRLTDLG
jgi:hypothetical protein